jgi:hypothetical protein
VASTSPGEAISLVGVKIHTLLSGDRYNTKTHEVIQLIKEVLE